MIKELISKNTPNIKLAELAYFPKRPKSILSSAVCKVGENPVLDQSKSFIAGYSNSNEIFKASKQEPVIIFGDHTCKLEFIDFDFVTSGPGVKLVKSSNFNLRYLYHALTLLGPRPGTYGRHFKYLIQTQVPYPPLDNQVKIANFLDQFSEAIKLQEESLSLLKIEKQILLEKIFGKKDTLFILNEKTFDTSKWESKKVLEVAPVTKEIKPKALFNDSCYVNTEEMIRDFGGVREFSSELKVTNVIVHRNGDILINRIRPYLKKVWLATNEGGTSGEIYICRPNEKLAPEFGFLALSTNKFISHLMKNVEGTKMPRATKESVNRYLIKVPPIPDQRLIAEYFANVDERIKLENERLDLLKLEQKIILEKIFTV